MEDGRVEYNDYNEENEKVEACIARPDTPTSIARTETPTCIARTGRKLISYFKQRWPDILFTVAVSALTTYIVKGKTVNVVNNNTNINNTGLINQGNPSKFCRCIETGEEFASQARAARAAKVSPSTLSQHLNGKIDHAGKHHFERID